MTPATRPDVSIVVPAWNAAGFIAPALASALAQTGPSIEVIVVDDASTDATGDVVRAVGDPRIRYVRMERNGGPSVARNHGFALARGEWIAVLDADDLIEPGRIGRMVARARAAKADVVVDNLRVVRPGGGAPQPMFPSAAFARMERLTLPDFIRSNMLFRKEFNYGYLKPLFRTAFLREAGIRYDAGIRIGEDYRFMAECLAAGAHCAVEPTDGYLYFIRPGSISRVLTAPDVEDIRRADEAFLSRYALDAPSRKAQAARDANLRDAHAMLVLIEHLKARRFAAALRQFAARPTAARLFSSPIGGRLKRLRAAFGRAAPAPSPAGANEAPGKGAEPAPAEMAPSR
ncbi:glycosyltransferase family 2 protein [Chthonobacter rhizosphaerae]|uniref:glycosyltransferase family 2 protein n=1 Tax=Chthonobacter rhizosphaerae TaxID=2735553 RepID=UPI0015EE9ADE|nr:glycosyltransferase family 2 protein [Chthonobacter rhizosphaerae]